MDEKDKRELLNWISGGKQLFSTPPPGFFRYMKKEGFGRDDLYIRMSDQAIVFFSDVQKAEEAAKERNEPFEACYKTEIVFPNSRGEDVM